MASVKGKTVLITGSAGGIGFCTAENFAKAGANLILTDVNKEALTQAYQKLVSYPIDIHTRVVDVSSRKQVEETAKWVNDEIGGLDILINNAGIGHSGELADTTVEEWEKLINVNLLGPLYHIYAFLPAMKKKGSGQIVNVSSGQAFFRLPTWGAYAAIKLALGAASELMSFEMKKYGIHVTTIYPFMVNTPFYSGIEGDTFGQKLSMKLVPYYSQKPETVGKIIFKAVKKKKRVEMVNILNDVGYYTRLVPPLSSAITWASNLFLAGSNKEEDAA